MKPWNFYEKQQGHIKSEGGPVLSKIDPSAIKVNLASNANRNIRKANHMKNTGNTRNGISLK